MNKIVAVTILCLLYGAGFALDASAAVGQGTCAIKRDSDGKIARSPRAVAQFKRQHPCPATGLKAGRCPGYIVDHAQALCKCGLDKPINMRWQTVKAARDKDRWECKPGWPAKLAACETVAGSCFK